MRELPSRAARLKWDLDNGIAEEMAGGVTTAFTWDRGAGLPQVLTATPGSAFVYGLGLLAQQQDGAWTYPLPDGLGSLRQWLDAGGEVLSAAGYAPFGAPAWQRGAAPAAWGFAGEYHDPAGLIYLRARWYAPQIGRFLTRDPFPGLAMLPETQHPYLYVNGNPINLTDPSGRIAPILLAIGAGVAIGGAVSGVGYVLAHPGGRPEDYLQSGAFWRAVGVGAASGAAAGGVGFLVGGIAVGGGLGGALGGGMLSGALGGTAGQVTANLLTPCARWYDDLVSAGTFGGLTGGIGGAAGYGTRRLLAATAKGVLQKLTTSANVRLAQDPTSASAVLSLDEYLAGQASPGVARMNYGKAVEGLVAEDIKSSWMLKGLFKPLGGAGKPDFVGKSLFGGNRFDITTNTPRSMVEHLERPYGPGLGLSLYTRPANFTTFP